MNLTTIAHRIYLARLEADENGVSGAPDIFNIATEGNFAQKPSTALDLQAIDLFSPKNVKLLPLLIQNGIAFSFSGGSAANKTFTYDIFAWSNENGPAHHLINGTGILGTQQVVKYPHNKDTATSKFWADTIVVTWDNVLKGVESTEESTGRNSIAEVWFDASGFRYFFPQISDADGSTGTEAGDIAVWYRYF